ncbi:MAG: hypothetical protein AABW84_00330 [Nanoarchaeota archaeon]
MNESITIGPSHHNKIYNWKIILAIVVLGAIAGIALLGQATPTGFFTSLPGAIAGEKTIQMTATFDRLPISAKGTYEELVLIYDSPNSVLKIDKSQLDVIGEQTLELRIVNFKGKISLDSLNPKLVSLEGEASKFYINGIGQTSDKTVDLTAHGLEVRSLILSGANLPSFSGTDMTGSVSFNNGKVTFNLDAESFEFGPFVGIVRVLETGQVQLEGITNYAKAKGLNIGDELNQGTSTETTTEPQTIGELNMPLPIIIPQEVESQTLDNTTETETQTSDEGMKYTIEGHSNEEVQRECIDVGLSKGECEDFLGVE